MLSFLADNIVVVALLALAVVALLLLGLVFWAALQNDESERKAARASRPQMNLDSLKQSFRTAVELIEANLAVRSERYNLAWAMVLNEGEGDTQLPIVQSGLPSALSTDTTLATSAVGIVWNFFDKGVAVQLQSAYLGGPDEGGEGQKTWDEFLGLCRGYRPERPFDSIVVALPARLLLASDPQAQLELASRAKALHRRLWLAQNRFAMRFPVYVVVSNCERIPGFSRFAAALPEAMRRGMLGWSSPFEVGAPYQPQWIDTGMDEVTRDVSDTTAELCALEPADEDSADYFMLATEVEKLRAGLKLYMDEVMRPSAYHEPFMFRGFYLCGDCSPVAELLARETQQRIEAPTAAEVDAGTDMLPVEEGGAMALPVAIPLQADLEPAFLRDIFEKKVFPEAGLARASRTQRMRHAGVRRAVRWTAVAAVAVWVVGLSWATYSLVDDGKSTARALNDLDADFNKTAIEDALRIEDDAGRKRAVKVLALMERVNRSELWSVWMPGSWPVFDPLHAQLKDHARAAISTLSVFPLRQGIYVRLNQLTGAPLDPGSGQLVIGAGCNWRAPSSNGDPMRVALNPEDLPELSEARRFVFQTQALAAGAQAFERLRSGRDPKGEDLGAVVMAVAPRDVVKYTDSTAKLFQQYVQTTAPLSQAAMQDASRCAFKQVMRSVHERLFERNELVRAERRLQQLTSAANLPVSETGVMLQKWEAVLDAMRQEDLMLQPGKGAWIKRRTLQLGAAYDDLLRAAAGAELIGAVGADEARRQAEEDLSRFLIQWDETQTDRLGLNAGRLKFVDAENRWAFSDERAAMRDALAALLAQPYMRPGRGKLPDIPGVSSVSWDRGRLDQALAFSDARKKFQAELLPKFPAGMQSGIEHMVNMVLAEQVIDTMAQGMSFSERPGASTLQEADRQRVSRVRVLLAELGARSPADALNAALIRDARARLRALDDNFNAGEVFTPRELRNWSGERAPLVVAFGAGDPMGLAAYVAQQQAFVETAAKEAEALLAGIEGLDANDPLVQRWRAIVADVAKYRLKSPASGLQALEQYILTQAADVELGNCTEKLSRTTQRGPNDIFGQRLVNIQVRLAARCRELRAGEQHESWVKFAEVFNRDLAGRAPFNVGMASSVERPPVDVHEVGAALKVYERAAKVADRSAPAFKRFDDQMERVKAFMAPLLTTDENAVPGYDLAVEFRANAAGESEGNKIIEWAVTVGNTTMRRGDPPKSLQWQPGMPVTVSLRFARDGPVAPAPDPKQPVMHLEERTVNFRYTDLWSLYSLIASHREPDGPNRSDPKSQLLRFEIPLFSGGEAMKTSSDQRARVFLRLAVSPAGKRAPLAWPGAFPIKAPEWAINGQLQQPPQQQ